MALIYPKSRRQTLTAGDRNALAKLASAIKRAVKRRWIRLKTLKQKGRLQKRTHLGLELEASAKEILAPVKGEKRFPTRHLVLPDEVDVALIRKQAGMSQVAFARAFCINPRTLQEWEQGRRKPDATTRAYLAVISKNREMVLKTLAS
jgi:putative transcriptional regulator